MPNQSHDSKFTLTQLFSYLEIRNFELPTAFEGRMRRHSLLKLFCLLFLINWNGLVVECPILPIFNIEGDVIEFLFQGGSFQDPFLVFFFIFDILAAIPDFNAVAEQHLFNFIQSLFVVLYGVFSIFNLRFSNVIMNNQTYGLRCGLSIGRICGLNSHSFLHCAGTVKSWSAHLLSHLMLGTMVKFLSCFRAQYFRVSGLSGLPFEGVSLLNLFIFGINKFFFENQIWL